MIALYSRMWNGTFLRYTSIHSLSIALEVNQALLLPLSTQSIKVLASRRRANLTLAVSANSKSNWNNTGMHSSNSFICTSILCKINIVLAIWCYSSPCGMYMQVLARPFGVQCGQ